MSRINHGIRPKRFNVKSNMTLQLIAECVTGERVTINIRNAALAGLGGALVDGTLTKDNTMIGQLLPESKLTWEGGELPLGRIVLRTMNESGTESKYLGFSCVDSKVPISGLLSKFFDGISTGQDNAYDYELSSRKYNIASFVEADHNHTDLFEKCHQYSMLWQDCVKNPLYQYYSVRQDGVGPRVNMKLSRTKKRGDYISFASYDYLGLAGHPEVKEAAIKAIEKFGFSPGGSLTLCGKTVLHEELEATLARMLGKDDVYLFGSGFAANQGAISCLLGSRDLALADLYSHTSIQEGIASGKAKARLFRHNSNKHLGNLLTELRGHHAGALVISEGLFSMDGDVPELQEMIETAHKHNAKVYVDECHSFGVLGENGLGASERCGVLEDVDIYMATLSKGIGAGGGFVASSHDVIQWMRSFARSGIFSGGLVPASVASALKSLEILQREPQRRQHLHTVVKRFRKGLQRLGFSLVSDPESPIVPVVVGADEVLGKMNQVLLDKGIFTNPVIYPAVPLNASRFRFSLTAAHSNSDIDLALNAVERAIEVSGYQPDLKQAG